VIAVMRSLSRHFPKFGSYNTHLSSAFRPLCIQPEMEGMERGMKIVENFLD
jgi:hypothetical protein